MSSVGVLDYGAGNLMNVLRAIEHLGFSHQLIQSPDDLKYADKLIIPGVGAYRVAMDAISGLGFSEPIRQFATDGKPVLGICLGMQLLFERSYEFGETPGLSLIEGEVVKIRDVDDWGNSHRIPHIGWNDLNIRNGKCHIVDNLKERTPVYFVHSYIASPRDPNCIIASCSYGGIEIPSIVGQGNVLGCQFHPEKSGPDGLKILNNFLAFS